MKRRRFLFIAAAAAFSGAARAENTTWQTDMLGGTVRVDLRGPRCLAQDIAGRIGSTIAEVEAAASLFKTSSALSRLNAACHLDDPPPALLDLLRLANHVHQATAGRFDPTVHRSGVRLPRGATPPKRRPRSVGSGCASGRP